MVNWRFDSVKQKIMLALYHPTKNKLIIAFFVALFALGMSGALPETVSAKNCPNGRNNECNGNESFCKQKTCVECPDPGQKQGCSGNKVCGNNFKCKDEPPAQSGGNPLPEGSGSVGSGGDDGGSDGSDPTPARISEEEDCEVNGVANAGTNTELGICIPKDPIGFAAAFYRVGLSLIGGLSIIFIIFGAYIMMTSEGNALRLQNGKTFIFYAIFGLLLAIFGYVFIEVIAIDILHIPGFTRQ